jgi:hypothetical protein
MKKLLFTLAFFAIIILYFFYPEKVITYPPGITAPDQPSQTNLSGDKQWQVDDYTFKALAEYHIKARVLSRNNFFLGEESNLSPFDLALGWGPMSDQSVIDKINISQRDRWYRFESDELPIPLQQISLNSANVHIIPKDEDVKNNFDEVYKGSLIELKGYLVQITKADGWHWVSSLRRDDTAGGACELMWVEEIIVLQN